jgi:hypothetical protein
LRAIALAALAVGFGIAAGPPAAAGTVKELIDRDADSVEIVTFGNARFAPVRVVRGGSAMGKLGGLGLVAPAQPHDVEIVNFIDPRYQPVTVIRGPSLRGVGIELFGPARDTELDRVAFAVEGLESAYGADFRMWRPDPQGPQGPMQVSEKAAIDVGGGDRFDLYQNRQLGRAYLAHLYRRYGNWADAVAAYNWGPGNLDGWIAGGRMPLDLPLEVERYRDRALRDAGVDAVIARSDATNQSR